MQSLNLKSFSKVNIGLKVLDKRKDGYHNIHTVFQEIDFHDTIVLKRIKSGFDFKSNVKWLGNDESNLCVRAWKCMAKHYNISGLSIKLTKNIPPGSGLGGGSSNAAAVLRGIAELYSLNVSKKKLCQLGSLLGADVPFFIRGGCQVGSGIGDKLSSVNNFLKGVYLLVIPEIHIDTQWAYKKCKYFLESSKEKLRFESLIKKDNIVFKYFENDFETIIVPAYPEIGKIKEKLKSKGAIFSSLSGTGSTVFGVFDDEAKAIFAKSLFKSSYQTILAYPTRN